MATERTTRNQRRLLVGLLVVATSLAAILGIVALNAGGEGKTTTAAAARPASTPSGAVRSVPHRPTTQAASGAGGARARPAPTPSEAVVPIPSRPTTTAASGTGGSVTSEGPGTVATATTE